MKTLTVKEAAKVLRVHPRTLYRRIKAGDVPAIRLGRAVRIPEESLRRLMGLPGTEVLAANEVIEGA